MSTIARRMTVRFAFTLLGCAALIAGGPKEDDADLAALATRQTDSKEDELQTRIRLLENMGYLGETSKGEKRSGVVHLDAEKFYGAPSFLLSNHEPGALLIDIHGEVLHRWKYETKKAFPDYEPPPEIEGQWRNPWPNAHLMENGDVIAIFRGAGAIKVDKDSRFIWKYSDITHHDLAAAENGNIFLATRKASVIPEIPGTEPTLEDFITVLGPDGKLIKRISILDCIRDSDYRLYFDVMRKHGATGDIMHNNTIHLIESSVTPKVSSFTPGESWSVSGTSTL